MNIERIDENHRIVTTEDRNFILRRKEGVDLWEVLSEKKQTLKDFAGSYTTWQWAADAVATYIYNLKRPTRKVA